tara:strand:- start:36 stop:314 length:279 start_codon:yes stop_codon:yes gene_type:complete
MRLKLKNIKKGQIFYEADGGRDIHCEAMEDARIIDNIAYCNIKIDGDDNDIKEFGQNLEYENSAYALRLDTERQYHTLSEYNAILKEVKDAQ